MSQRTDQQNRALHLYCTQVANAFNEAGFDKVAVLTQKAIPVSWDPDAVKHDIWKSIQVAIIYDKNGKPKVKTSKLESHEVNKVYKQMSRWLAEKFGISIPFPSYETMGEDH